MNKKLNLEIGTKFGKWEVVSESTTRKNNLTHWQCKCECGNVEFVPLNNLMNGSSTQCSTCAAKSGGLKRRKGYKDITGTFWANIKNKAKQQEKFFDIRIEDAWQLYKKQKKVCAYSGLPLTFKGYESQHQIADAVLTLVNTNGEYTIDNVKWIHKDVAKLKGNLSEVELITLIDSISYHYSNQNEEKNYYIEDGKYIFTEKYHLERGWCCRNNCRHCPYGYNG